MTTPTTRARRALTSLAVVATLGAGALGGVLALPAATVAAAPNHAATSSAAIAKRATGAVRALGQWEAQRRPADYVRYVQSRDAVADLIAAEIGLLATDVRADLAQPAVPKQHAALAALTQLGVPYRRMQSAPGEGFDCSGLTSWAYAQAGIAVPRVSGDQIRASQTRSRELSEAGDLVHYPGHVGIYLGGTIYVHSPEPGRTVEVIEMPDRSLDFGDVSTLTAPQP